MLFVGRVSKIRFMKDFLVKYARFVSLFIAAVLVGTDQLTKWLIVSNMQLHDKINLIKFGDTEVLNIYYCTNNGSAFSMMSGRTGFLIFISSATIILFTAAILLQKIKKTSLVYAVSLVIGGGAGNLIDRVFNNGHVVDFIDVRIINFAIFNFADICAVVGGFLICLLVLIDEIKAGKAKKSQSGEQESNGED